MSIYVSVAMHKKILVVDCAFPGGNIVIEKINGNNVFLHQDLRDTIGHWFYWYYRVRNAKGRTLVFHFTNGNVISERGPAISLNKGKTWVWLGIKTVKDASFQYSFPSNKEIRFCFGMPYQEKNLNKFLAVCKKHPNIKIQTLCKTRKGRRVERLRLGCLNEKTKNRVLITCRHHSCEMTASHSLEGIMETILADTDDGKWFSKNVEFLIIPFLDKDGVEDGDQGKGRKPHDHNKDYKGNSIYPEVKALRKFVPKWSKEKLRIALDLHCPFIRNEKIYLVGSSLPKIWQQQCIFSKILESVQTSNLVFKMENNRRFGSMWNKKSDNGKSSRYWAEEIPGIKMVSSIEIPYATAGGKEVNTETAREFGRDIAKAIRVYLEQIYTKKI